MVSKVGVFKITVWRSLEVGGEEGAGRRKDTALKCK